MQQFMTMSMPKHIDIDKVKHTIENQVKEYSRGKYSCEVVFQKFEDNENTFSIIANAPEEFYLAGMVASGMLDNIKKKRPGN